VGRKKARSKILIALTLISAGMKSSDLKSVKKCDLDLDYLPKNETSNFKFILIDIDTKNLNQNDPQQSENLQLVRGTKRLEFHADISEEFENMYPKYSSGIVKRSGGWLSYNPQARTIEIYGKSIAYGPSDHEIVRKIIQSSYPDIIVSIRN